MTEQLGTKDVVEQLSSRLGNVEEGLRDLRQEVRGGLDAAAVERNAGFAQLRGEMRAGLDAAAAERNAGFAAAAAERNAGFAQIHAQLSTHLRWMAGTLMLSWLSLMVSIWLKG